MMVVMETVDDAGLGDGKNGADGENLIMLVTACWRWGWW